MSDSQKQRVKEILRSASSGGVCSLFLYDVGLPNGRTRVYELRDDDGLDIATVRCEEPHENDAPTHVRFVWHWKAKPRQLALMEFPIATRRKEVART